jgi:hypothetical protein
LISSVNRPVPAMKRKSSLRRTARPMPNCPDAASSPLASPRDAIRAGNAAAMQFGPLAHIRIVH